MADPSFKKLAVDKISALITAAFGLVAALAWNGAIQNAVTTFLGTASQLAGMIVYAVIVTIIAVIVTIYIAKVAEKVK